MSKEKKKPTRQQIWRKRNPKKYACHLAAQNALRLGVIKRQPCEVCGGEKADMHHDDYSRPFDVRFLCRRHHKQHHAKGPKDGA